MFGSWIIVLYERTGIIRYQISGSCGWSREHGFSSPLAFTPHHSSVLYLFTFTGGVINIPALGRATIIMDLERVDLSSELKRLPHEFPATHRGQSTPRQLYARLYYSAARLSSIDPRASCVQTLSSQRCANGSDPIPEEHVLRH